MNILVAPLLQISRLLFLSAQAERCCSSDERMTSSVVSSAGPSYPCWIKIYRSDLMPGAKGDKG